MRDEKERGHTENGEASIAKGEHQYGDILVVCLNVSEKEKQREMDLGLRVYLSYVS